MSIKNREIEFSIQTANVKKRLTFAGICELGFNRVGNFIIAAWTTPADAPGEPRGSYLTSIPISPFSYRRKHGNGGTGFTRKRGRLLIYDDYGTPMTIWAPTAVLNELVGECVANWLPQLP